MSPRVRYAETSDVPAVVRLVESAYRGEASRAGWTTEADLLDGQRTDAGAVRATLAGPGVLLVLEDDDGQLVGCCEVRPVSADTCYFGMFAVSPTRQGAGLGGRMLQAAEELAAGRFGASRMEMTVIAQRADLIAWYARRGYAPTGERRPFPYGDERFGIPKRDDLEFVVLAKRLATPRPVR